MIELISAILACAIWTIGVIIMIFLIAEWDEDLFENFLVATILFGALGLTFGIPSFVSMSEITSTEYYEPTQVVHTNNTTHIIFIGDKLYTKSDESTAYWTATNIMVRIECGKNIWGADIRKSVDFVIPTNNIIKIER